VLDGFTKLFGRIIHSTIWQEDHPTRVLWITMLAMADRDGMVHATIPGLANAARITIKECETGLTKFQQPDRYSRSKVDEGKRVREVHGGWILINYETYRALMSAEQQRESARIRQQRWRKSRSVTPCHDDVTQSHRCNDIADADADADAKAEAVKVKSATPANLHPMQYAAHICDALVIPQKGNMETVSGAIEALARSMNSTPSEAHDYLLAKAVTAKDSGEAVNIFWFRDGKYNQTRRKDDDYKTTAQLRNERSAANIDRAFREVETSDDMPGPVR
jgi:hypothetical protein